MKVIVIFMVIMSSVLSFSGCHFKSVTQDLSLKEEEVTNQNETDIVMETLSCIIKQENEIIFYDLEQVCEAVNLLGEKEIVAIDSKNQISMTCIDKVESFYNKVKKKEEADLTIYEIVNLKEFICCQLRTKDGSVNVSKNRYMYLEDAWENKFCGEYVAKTFTYTDEGYLMFSGDWMTEEQYVLSMCPIEDYSAYRVITLDETCKLLNRKYLLPIGYAYNNMFLINWNEDNYADLNFYDLYDKFYQRINGKASPYTPNDNLGIGSVYHIPKTDFEHVIQKYFHINSETLQEKTIFDAVDESYEYKPRGLYEVEYPQYPYPEVINYKENVDGTITLTVNVVYPYESNSKVFAHEVVIRPLEDGSAQYVSNHIVSSGKNIEYSWYTPRLTNEEWEEIYEENM